MLLNLGLEEMSGLIYCIYKNLGLEEMSGLFYCIYKNLKGWGLSR